MPLTLQTCFEGVVREWGFGGLESAPMLGILNLVQFTAFDGFQTWIIGLELY